MKIGSITLKNNLILAPMAGVTDKPFRQLCRELGAGLAVSEMITSNIALWNSKKSRHRLDHRGEDSPRAVQIAGADPDMMAQAARLNVENGAEIIDINMGCPAKKVCNVMAGSALLQNEQLVAKILENVVKAVSVPVTLKIRTGSDTQHRNAISIARLAQQTGIRMLSVHGRTRACAFTGKAEHETVAEIKNTVSIPVVANGDISSPQQVARILKQTGVDGIMIGRAAQGNPWIFRQINHYLATGELQSAPSAAEICTTLVRHLENLYDFYGEYMGVRIARKHIGWYCKQHQGANLFRSRVNGIESTQEQLETVRDFFGSQEKITVQELAA